jgi:hypothetical protein
VARPKKLTSAPGPSEISTWEKQIVPQGSTMVSGTPSTGFDGQAGIGVNLQAQTLYNLSIKERAEIAQALKNAGYRGFPTNGLYNQALANAYSSALMAAETSAMQLGQPFNNDFFTGYLGQEIAARNALTTGTGGPKVTEQRVIATEDQAKALIDTVFKDQFGRSASKEEINKYTNALQKAQKKSPVVTTTTKVGGKNVVTTTGGVNSTQYLLDKVSGTDEAKANKVLGFYETFMKALGAD